MCEECGGHVGSVWHLSVFLRPLLLSHRRQSASVCPVHVPPRTEVRTVRHTHTHTPPYIQTVLFVFTYLYYLHSDFDWGLFSLRRLFTSSLWRKLKQFIFTKIKSQHTPCLCVCLCVCVSLFQPAAPPSGQTSAQSLFSKKQCVWIPVTWPFFGIPWLWFCQDWYLVPSFDRTSPAERGSAAGHVLLGTVEPGRLHTWGIWFLCLVDLILGLRTVQEEWPLYWYKCWTEWETGCTPDALLFLVWGTLFFCFQF